MSRRFIRRGVSQFYWLPPVPDYRSITRDDLASGTNITPEVADVAGWQLENQSAAVPDMGSRFEKSIPGLDSAADSSITCYEPEEVDESEGAIDISALMPKGSEGVFVILRRGDKPGSLSLDAFPSRVASNSPEFSAGNDPARVIVSHTITDEPAQDQVVPPLAG